MSGTNYPSKQELSLGLIDYFLFNLCGVLKHS